MTDKTSEQPSTTYDSATLRAWDHDYVMGTYGKLPAVFVRGAGAKLWDLEGKEYLDFLAGIAVCGVGHCHPRVTKAIADQAGKLMHVSNLYYTELQPRLAKRLTALAGMDKAFFANSGAEANECAIKIARKWGKAHGGPERHEIITFNGSFHGRTLATITATAQPKYQEAFKPLPPGFRYLNVGDLAGLDEAIGEKTCAVMIEPIQGESGVKPVSVDFLHAIRALCDEAGALLIFDEVQTGMGRSGSFLASQLAGVQGDIVTLAKSIAGGVPMGCCLARGEAANTLVPGDHASTFGGQPLAAAAALAVLDIMEDEGLIENAAKVGAYFKNALDGLREAFPDKVVEARGVGLMVGLELSVPEARNVMLRLFDGGIVCNAIGDRVLRFVPPLVVTEADCDRVVASLRQELGAL